MHICSSVQVVIIGDFRHVQNSLVRLLQARHHDRHISSCREVLPFLVSQVLVFNVQQKLSIISSEMRYSESVVSVAVIFHDILGVGP